MRKLFALTTLAALAVMASAQAPKVTLGVGDQAPPLVIAKWAKGEPVAKLGNGKINVVEFWATWCGPCKVSIPHLTELAKKYAGKVDFIGVDSFERLPDDNTCFDKVAKFVDDEGDKMDYHVAIDGHDGTMGKTWMDAAGQNGIPTAFVIGKDGKIQWIGHPMNLDKVMDKIVDGTFDSKAEAARQKEEMAKQMEAQKKQMEMFAPLNNALKAKDYRGAVIELDRLSAQNHALKLAYTVNRVMWMSNYDAPAAMSAAEALATNEFKADAASLNTLAWAMVEDKPEIKGADYKIAVKIAEQAVKVSKEDPMIMDTLALAYFRAKRSSDAIATETKAIEKANATAGFDATTLGEFKTRLASFNAATSTNSKN